MFRPLRFRKKRRAIGCFIELEFGMTRLEIAVVFRQTELVRHCDRTLTKQRSSIIRLQSDDLTELHHTQVFAHLGKTSNSKLRSYGERYGTLSRRSGSSRVSTSVSLLSFRRLCSDIAQNFSCSSSFRSYRSRIYFFTYCFCSYHWAIPPENPRSWRGSRSMGRGDMPRFVRKSCSKTLFVHIHQNDKTP